MAEERKLSKKEAETESKFVQKLHQRYHASETAFAKQREEWKELDILDR